MVATGVAATQERMAEAGVEAGAKAQKSPTNWVLVGQYYSITAKYLLQTKLLTNLRWDSILVNDDVHSLVANKRL